MPLPPVLLASQQSTLHLSLAGLVLGLVIAVFGHITRTRWLIVIGIGIIGVISALFSFVLRPGAG